MLEDRQVEGVVTGKFGWSGERCFSSILASYFYDFLIICRDDHPGDRISLQPSRDAVSQQWMTG